MSTCVNHPIKMATARCKCCGKPLCNECKRITDAGIFCSPECENKTRQFTERAAGYTVSYRRSLFTKRTLKGLVVLAVLAAGAAGYFYFIGGVQSWTEFKTLVAKWWEARHLILP